MPSEAQSNPQQTGAPADAAPEQAITSELVNVIADRVYAMLVREMRVERERQPHTPALLRGPGGKAWQ